MQAEIQRSDQLLEGNAFASFSLLRLDLPDPLSGGNKSYKLKYNLLEMQWRGLKRLLTFGGAFSNHIAAVAFAGKQNKFETIGIIRGEELHADSNEVLRFAASCGMKLVFVSREEYRKRNEKPYCEKLLAEYGPAYLLPEGGSNAFAVKGCKEILSAQTEQYDAIICPVGTGATLAGIISAANTNQEVTGIAVLNGKNYLEEEVRRNLSGENPGAHWRIEHGFTLGGYAQTSPGLQAFISEMQKKHALPLDPVYSGKTLFAIDQLKTGDIFRGKHLLYVHTGGYAFSALPRMHNFLSE